MFDQIDEMTDEIVDIPIPGEPRNTLVIRLRRRNDGVDSYQARRIIPKHLRKNDRNPYKTKSLKTTDLDSAKLLAIKWERTLFAKIELGEELYELAFDKVAREYLKDTEARTSQVDTDGEPLVLRSNFVRDRSVTERYLIPFFGKTDITSINQLKCDHYVRWRLDYYLNGPGKEQEEIKYNRAGKTLTRPLSKNVNPAPSTVNKDAVAFNKIVRFARLHHAAQTERCGKIKVPKIKSHRARRRPRFFDDELVLMSETLIERCIDSTGRTAHVRHMLQGFVDFLLGTGLRVSEAHWIQMRHLELRPLTEKRGAQWDAIPQTWETESGLTGIKHSEIPFLRERPASFRIRVAANNPGLKHPDHSRLVIPTHYYSECLMQHLLYLSGRISSISSVRIEDPFELDPEQFLFINQDGSRIKSFAKGFEAALNAAISKKYPNGLLRYEGKRRSLTSLRHTYASKQIEAGATANGLGFLADNMGTSADMLRKHYGQVLHELKADDLQLY